jgi:hypothetical protein
MQMVKSAALTSIFTLKKDAANPSLTMLITYQIAQCHLQKKSYFFTTIKNCIFHAVCITVYEASVSGILLEFYLLFICRNIIKNIRH